MPFFSKLNADSGVRDILKMNARAGKALIEFHEAVMRQPSPLSSGERELIAAYVSGLNACHYCHGVHSLTAEAFGIDDGVLAALLNDVATAKVDIKLKPILNFVRKLTLMPARMTRSDAGAVFAAGWDEQALHDVVNVCCLFNFMNRLIEGHGVKGNDKIFDERGRALKEQGYAPLLKILGFG
ncbi:MAG: peroxidase-related enzyme [Proteobacteria bacterium]|nr:peroxidase-related enzyme [Pseudomonadota bacterium]